MELIASKLYETGLEVFLEDLYLKSRTSLSLNDTTKVDFSVDDNCSSKDPNRFRIIFEAAAGPLPVYFSSVRAYAKNNDISVEWKTENENNIMYFEIERSFDGSVFKKTEKIEAGNNLQNNYEWIDIHPEPGTLFYRIKSIERQREIKYSPIVSARISIKGSNFFVYPNPVQNGVINLKFVNQPGGNYKIRLLNNLGQVVLNRIVNH